MHTLATSPTSGNVVGGRYRIDTPIGAGGFGTVYRATQLNLNRAVALKVLNPGLFAAEGAHDRFCREASLAQQLKHPNTVRVFDFGTTDTGLPFIVWELMEGLPLDALLSREGPQPPGRVVRMITQVLKALMEAHGLGIVHRDIKPSNLFVSNFHGEPDFVKVLDFGVAKALVERGPAITSGTLPVGTPSYMAPEQVRNDVVGPATDLYAVGLVMAEMLTGAPVFQGRTLVDVFMAQASEAPAPIPLEVVHGPLGVVIARATDKIAARRYPSAAEMLHDIERLALVTPPPQMMPAASAYAATLPAANAGAASLAVPTTPAPGQYAISPYPNPAGLTPNLVTAMPAPTASRSSSVLWFVAGGFMFLALVGAGIGGGVLWMMTASTQSPPISERPPEKSLQGIGAETIGQRIASRGWKLDGEPILNLEGSYQMNIISIKNGPRQGVVNIYDFVDVLEAEKFGKKLQQDKTAVARDKDLLLSVVIQGDPAEATKLLELVTSN